MKLFLSQGFQRHDAHLNKKCSLICNQAPAAGQHHPSPSPAKERSRSRSLEEQDYRGGESSETVAPSKDQVNPMPR